MKGICPTAIAPLIGIWTALHKDLEVVMDAAEARYLNGVLLGLDDELVAHLLAAKLAMSRPPGADRGQAVAHRGSLVAYAVRGRELQTRLVHGSSAGVGRLGVATRFGTALLGLRAGQSVLWPTALGRLVEVRILAVEAAPRRSVERPLPTVRGPRTSCASG